MSLLGKKGNKKINNENSLVRLYQSRQKTLRNLILSLISCLFLLKFFSLINVFGFDCGPLYAIYSIL